MRRPTLALILAFAITTSGALAQTVDASKFIVPIPPPQTIPILPPEVLPLAAQAVGISVSEEGNELRISLSGDILFDFDKSSLRKSAEPALRQAADLITTHRAGRVRVEGHTDSKGSDAYNKKLSLRRSQSVRTWLAQATGLSPENFAVKGFAASRPVAPNTNDDGSDNPEGREKNRRVEIVIEK